MKNLNNFYKTCKDAGIIVEIGGNHEGDIDYAYSLVNSAISAGAHSIKLQSYTSKSLVNYKLNPERAKHFEKFTLPYQQQIEIAKYINSKGAMFMSSLWDLKSLEMLDPYIDIHKVGSGDLTNYSMIFALCETKKPLILSTAMSDIALIKETVSFIYQHFPEYKEPGRLGLLHCVAMYGDLNDKYANLMAIKDLKINFPEITIGYSDHTLGVEAAILSLSLGAELIEVHFTDDKNREFRDHHLSINKEELILLNSAYARSEDLFGNHIKDFVDPVESVERITEFRRACFLNKNIETGHKISEEDLIALRPMQGIDARNFYSLIGRKALLPIKKLETLDWSMFD
jgi:N,N'-diacetyllegionaminate synthase